MARRRFKHRAAELGEIDCPNCGECDDRNLGENRCAACECRFVIQSYSTKAVWRWIGGNLTRTTLPPAERAKP